MKKLRALIVDDELKSREVIKSLVETFCPEVDVVGTAEDIVGSIAAIEAKKPDLVFLDISLKEGDSFQILQQLNEINFDIIFVTAYDEYSIKALKYSGIKCLLKPLDIDELQQAVKEVAIQSTNMNTAYKMVNGILKSGFKKIPVITSSGLQFSSIKDITYIQQSNDGSTIHFIDEQMVKSKRKISEFDDIIVSEQFKLVDSDFMVNLDLLDPSESSKKQLVFKNGVRVDIGTYDFSRLFDWLR
jgi:two-component system LytT family response regulator